MAKTKRMRIALISENSVVPFRSGGFRTVNCALELKKRGHFVLIFAPSEKKSVEGIEVVQLIQPMQGKSLFGLFLKVISFEIRVLFNLLKNRKRFDAILLRSTVPAFAAYPFAKLFHKKIMLDMTDVQSEYLKGSAKGFFMKKIVSMLCSIEYSMIHKFSRIVTVSEEMKRIVVAHKVDASRVSVVYDGADLDKFKPAKKKSKMIIHHGGASTQDGVEMIPKAAVSVLKKYPDAKFYIVGMGNRIEAVKKIALDYGVMDSFIFTGWLPFDEMEELLASSEIGLVTRPNTPANNAVLTLKMLEYWAVGAVPVIPKLKAMQEVATDFKNVLFFDPENVTDLAEKILKLLDNKKLMSKMSKNGIAVSKKFSWKALMPKLVDICEEEFSK